MRKQKLIIAFVSLQRLNCIEFDLTKASTVALKNLTYFDFQVL